MRHSRQSPVQSQKVRVYKLQERLFDYGLMSIYFVGHSQYSNGVAKLVDDKKITCTKVSRQIQLSLADLAPPASSVASPPVASSSSAGEKTVSKDNKTSSDTQYYF